MPSPGALTLGQRVYSRRHRSGCLEIVSVRVAGAVAKPVRRDGQLADREVVVWPGDVREAVLLLPGVGR